MMRCVLPIRFAEGSEGFLKAQYEVISKLAIVVSVIIFLSHLRPTHGREIKGVEKLGGFTLAFSAQ